MLLYVNGCSHTAAAEAVNSFAFAEDDGNLGHLGRLPHPDNLAVSWGQQLANLLSAEFYCDAESAASCDRIIRTTKAWIGQYQGNFADVFMAIQWPTWEREEWLINGVYYQVNASGVDVVPKSHQEQYKKFVTSVNWQEVTEKRHREIWSFHANLESRGIKHVFFNGNNDFGKIPECRRYRWDRCYVGPYNNFETYNTWLSINKFATKPQSWHFGKDAHRAWAEFMLQYITDNKLIENSEIYSN